MKGGWARRMNKEMIEWGAKTKEVRGTMSEGDSKERRWGKIRFASPPSQLNSTEVWSELILGGVT